MNEPYKPSITSKLESEGNSKREYARLLVSALLRAATLLLGVLIIVREYTDSALTLVDLPIQFNLMIVVMVALYAAPISNGGSPSLVQYIAGLLCGVILAVGLVVVFEASFIEGFGRGIAMAVKLCIGVYVIEGCVDSLTIKK